jgi:hypothetical protein
MTLDQRAREAAANLLGTVDAVAIPDAAAIGRRVRRRRLGAATTALLAVGVTVTIIVALAAGDHTASRIDVGVDTPDVTTSAPEVPSTAPSPTKTLPWIATALEPNTRDTWAHFIDPGTTREAPGCGLQALLVRANVGGAGGTQYLGVRVQNRSRSACTLVGAPYAGLLDTQGHTIGRLLPDPAAARTLILVPMSWATVSGIALSKSTCGNNVAAVAFGLNAGETVTVSTSGTPPTASRCGTAALQDQTAPPFAPLDSAFSDPSFLSLSFDAGSVLDAPRSVRRGQVLQYSVTITNTGENSLGLETNTLSGMIDGNCPLYRQSLGPTTSPSLLLNCGNDGLILQPDEAMRFEMRFAIPTDQPLGRNTLRWQYLEPAEPALTLPITVVDG